MWVLNKIVRCTFNDSTPFFKKYKCLGIFLLHAVWCVPVYPSVVPPSPPPPSLRPLWSFSEITPKVPLPVRSVPLVRLLTVTRDVVSSTGIKGVWTGIPSIPSPGLKVGDSISVHPHTWNLTDQRLYLPCERPFTNGRGP